MNQWHSKLLKTAWLSQVIIITVLSTFQKGRSFEGGAYLSQGVHWKQSKLDTSLHISLTFLVNKYDLLNLKIITKCVCKFHYYKKQRIYDWRKLLVRHSYKISEWTPLQTLRISKWAPLSWFEGGAHLRGGVH